MSKTVVLTGFPGSGKTAVGEELKKSYGWNWFDLDEEIENKVGSSITNIIRVEGIEHFRVLEAELLKTLLDANPEALSLGGGVLLSKQNVKLLEQKSFLRVSLCCSEEIAASRICADEAKQSRLGKSAPLRPLVAEVNSSEEEILAKVQKLARERDGLYEKADVRVWTDFSEPQKAAQAVNFARETAEGTGFLPAQFEEGIESLLVNGERILGLLKPMIADLFEGASKAAVLVDEAVQAKWQNYLSTELEQESFEVRYYPVAQGEASKDVKVVESLTRNLLEDGFTRGDIIVGCGGGVVGDLAGLLASLYMRGVGLVLLPTSLVAQVDAAIGGKTAVNVAGAGQENARKNVLGTFYPARIVMSDVAFLETLPEREYQSGLAEVVKYGLIGSEEFFSWLEKNAESILGRDKNNLKKIIEFCSRAKLDYVVQDLTDVSGRRALLNFGHTVGHAIESLTNCETCLHGEAVSIGMVQALALGEKLGKTENGVLKRSISLLEKLNLPVKISEDLLKGAKGFIKQVDNEGFFKRWSVALNADKKRASDGINFVFINKVGRSEVSKVQLNSLITNLAESSTEDV